MNDNLKQLHILRNMHTPFDKPIPTHIASPQQHKFDLEYKDINRNDKCPCGSNKKFKQCCLLLRPKE